MFYFREEEFQRLERFLNHPSEKAMAIYGRKRAGKTRLLTEYMSRYPDRAVFLYYQCTSYDYRTCLSDFLAVVRARFPEETYPSSMTSFRDAVTILTRMHPGNLCIIMDEFPFLAKKDDNVPVEFQWIIDHGLGSNKLILVGSSQSFMKKQIGSREAPLYGRFDEIMEIRPFTFGQLVQLFSSQEDAMKVYSMTGGIAQYVMFFLDYPSVDDAVAALFFLPDGRLFREAPNMLFQELRDPTTYELILRGIGGSEKNTTQIAKNAGIDSKGFFPYLTRLQELDMISTVANPLSAEKRKQRYQITDALFRFHYTFIEPNMSMINSLREKSAGYILDHRYQEFVGVTYEHVIRENCFQYALEHRIPFMPETIGKWWGPVYRDSVWQESEVDVIAYDDDHLLVGECQYRSKAMGIQELTELRVKAEFIPAKGRKLCYLLASRSGFTEELLSLHDPNVILIDSV